MPATLVVGTVLLAVSFRTEPGSGWFYPATLALAATWIAGALAVGPVRPGRRALAPPVLVGLGLAALFVVGALVVREVPSLADQVAAVTEYADRGTGPLVVLLALLTGVAEELFFRGALYDVLSRPIPTTTAVYALVTIATGNPMLVAAAALLGLVTALQRRAGGGVLAPAITHATWSLAMLLVLPRLF